MILIKKSSVADTRTCDWSKVSKEQLGFATIDHINDVKAALDFWAEELWVRRETHDHDKLTKLDQFHQDFLTSFKDHAWWDEHKKHRHHNTDTLEDVNLIDILETICDGVMAGLARSGEYRPAEFSNEVLQRAIYNTAQKLIKNTKVVD